MILQKIFFSYSRSDGSQFALKLALDLKKEGFNIWIDQEDIRAGSEWDIEIEKALETCDCLLFVETEKSVTSNNVIDEVYYALEQHKKVIPLIVRDSKTPFRLQRLQHIDFSKDYNSGLRILINELKGNTPIENEIVEESPVVQPAPFFLKRTRVIQIIICLVIIAAFIIYKLVENKTTGASNLSKSHTQIPDNNIEAASKAGEIMVEKAPTQSENQAEAKNQSNKPGGKKADVKKIDVVNMANDHSIKAADLAGDWDPVSVEDANAGTLKGYLKIDIVDAEKLSVKMYGQFYYSKSNDTSFLTVFNAFAGCSSCALSEEIKLEVEDVAVGSHTYTILQSGTGDAKAGDTLKNTMSNKSIRASAMLHFVNNKTAIIKIQRTVPTELAPGLVLKPFVYTFHFAKSDY